MKVIDRSRVWTIRSIFYKLILSINIGTERLPATIRLAAIAPAMDVMICRILGACATCKPKLCVAKLVQYAPERHAIQDSEANKACHYRSVRLSTMHWPLGSNLSGAVSTKLCMSSMYRKIRLEFHAISNKQTPSDWSGGKQQHQHKHKSCWTYPGT